MPITYMLPRRARVIRDARRVMPLLMRRAARRRRAMVYAGGAFYLKEARASDEDERRAHYRYRVMRV